jgi:hypothetical protein
MEVAMKLSRSLGAFVVAGSTLLAAAAVAGEGSYENLVKEMLNSVDQMTKVLSTITDQGSADAARPDLKKAAAKMLELRKQAEEWKQPNKEEKDHLAKEYAPKFETAFKKLKEQSNRVRGIPGGEAALEELAVLKDKDKDKKDGK